MGTTQSTNLMPPGHDMPYPVEILVEPLVERLFHFTDISGTHEMYITRSDASCSEVMKHWIDSGMISNTDGRRVTFLGRFLTSDCTPSISERV